jgi:hypothetical protein
MAKNINRFGISITGFLAPEEHYMIHHLQGTLDTVKQIKYTEDELVRSAKKKLKEWDL